MSSPPTLTDNHRLLTFTTPLGDSVLLVDQFNGTERVSGLFNFSLHLLSQQGDIDLGKIVGNVATLSLEQPGGSQRYWNGIVSRFTQIASDNTYFRYEAELVPWLWYLQYTEDSRIFQEESVPAIIEAVFKQRGFTDFKNALSTNYATRSYCVQYRETDFDFVHRLLQEEGIFYYFEHQQHKHTLVLADAMSAINPCAVKAILPYRPAAGTTDGDDITSWTPSLTIVPNKVSLRDYNFEQPSTDLSATSPSVATQAKKESLDCYSYYPGRYSKVSEGEHYAKLIMQGYESRQWHIVGAGDCRTLASGKIFTLSKHFRNEYNGDYMLLSVSHSAVNNLPWTNNHNAYYSNQFTCQSKTLPYRPVHTTAKALIHGVHTAVVVGSPNEEIYTDKYGRVKVQFPWDRQGRNDDRSSCWIRVSQGWAGLSWGSMYIPRVGQEVLVEFLDGNPDQPIITGRLYNAEKMPPYQLPTYNTQSGIKSRSTPQGSADNFNELRFEDKKGSEDIYFHAEKDFHRLVKNDDVLQVNHDRNETVTNNRIVSVRSGDNSLNIDKGNLAVTIAQGNATVAINQGKRSITVEGDDQHEVKAGDRVVVVGTGNDIHQIKQGNRSVELALGNDVLTINSGNQTTQIKLGSCNTEALQSIQLKVGENVIMISQSGITIKGMTVMIEGATTAQLKAPMAEVDGSAMLTLKGGLTQIN